ncbi:hypothetical protein J8L88_06910 [Aquimarina sp. MMG015]|uniref:hypothetical protein n=1 Tax=Aquimarina sp. MMG015 TaxID=2822689 RepID=UPI001B39EF5E|nr:hypothetical protein [Aquimarina sp. MMG015]MBQ4802583.1 hypothetical protein [Aquimarina sp. MMG015]
MRKIVLLFTMLVSIVAQGQDDYYGGYSPSATTTPTAAKISGGGSATVNLTSGSAQQYVPIYNIEQNGVSWSTGLQYSYSGLRVMEEPSPIGLGWDLAATGMVSREVRGLPDDHPKGYYGSENLRSTILDPYYYFDPNANNAATNGKQVIKEHHAYLLAQGLMDGEPDVFHVNAGGINFSFKLGENLQPVLLSHHNVKITFTWNQITVTDSEGVRYIFGAKEIFTPVPEDDIVQTFGNGQTTALLPIEPNYPYTRSWYLSSIQPPNTTQQISFTYQNHLFKTKAFLPKIYSYKGLQAQFLEGLLTKFVFIPGGGGPFQSPQQQPPAELQDGQDPNVYTHTRLDVDVTVPVLKQITFADGSLHFNTASVSSGAHHKYTSIDLKDFHGQLINSYDFYTQGTRDLLKEIQTNNEFAFGFDYYYEDIPSAIPAFEYSDKEVNSTMDAWGYYNGSQTPVDQLKEEASVESILSHTVAGALKSIHYKTGGQTDIQYELNRIPQEYENNNTSNGSFTVFSRNTNTIGTSRKQVRSGTFTSATQIEIEHKATVKKYGSRVQLKIFKEGYTGDYVPYTDCNNNNGIAQLYINVVGEREELAEGLVQYDSYGKCTFTIQPGTYTFFVETEANTEAEISVKITSPQNYKEETYDQLYGGIRVASIRSCPIDTDQCTEKVYQYTNDQLGSSAKVYTALKMEPQKYWYGTTNSFYIPFYVKGRGLPIYYSQVSESVVSADPLSNAKNGKTVYTYEDPYFFNEPYDFRTREYYDRAPKGVNEGGLRIGTVKTYKTESHKSVPKDKLISEQLYEYESVIAPSDFFGNATSSAYPYGIKVIAKTQIKREMHYDKLIPIVMQQNNMNVLPLGLQDFQEYYENRTQAEFEDFAERMIRYTGFNINSVGGQDLFRMAKGVGSVESDQAEPAGDRNDMYAIVSYKDTNVQYQRKKVTSKTYSDMDLDQFQESIQEFEYDSNQQVVEQRSTSSKGATKKAKYYYPYHSTVNNTTLVSGNRIASPVKTETFHGSQKQSTALVNFDSWNPGGYLPRTIQSAKESAPLQDQTIFHKYDTYGNPLETSAREGIHTIYVWGYNNTTPIAVITNATYVGMSSAVQNLINAAITASNNDTNASSENQLRTALQNLRNHSYFSASQMVTYTYDPLIGMTSTTDVRNRTAYYEYDSLHRLYQVKDQEGNILSTNEYNYKNN